MKIVWTIVALLLLAGLVVLFQPEAATGPDDFEKAFDAMPEVATPRAAEIAPSTDGPDAAASASLEPTSPTSPGATPSTTPAAVAPLVTAPVPGLRVEPAYSPKPTTPAAPTGATTARAPSAEPARPAIPEGAALAAFEPDIPAIPHAEILPSTFARLPDGAIAVDDAWTVRGDGSAEKPYEVSWEFLASAQEDYAPRLGEKKLPARIAFLSGKHVRISGYLAFPLVAPTASECLVMLNQWDGCCIGIPPTPYDAIEVKLAGAIKGWQRHSINFGAVEGLFKVEPYLVENWLVGLYLLEGAKIDTEL
ncbi:MAG: hypothetical protein RI967_1345 [Planctomycetota bacterium]